MLTIVSAFVMLTAMMNHSREMTPRELGTHDDCREVVHLLNRKEAAERLGHDILIELSEYVHAINRGLLKLGSLSGLDELYAPIDAIQRMLDDNTVKDKTTAVVLSAMVEKARNRIQSFSATQRTALSSRRRR